MSYSESLNASTKPGLTRLTAWTTLVESGPPDTNAFIVQTLRHWQQDSDLAGIRDVTELARLTGEEQGSFNLLWEGVAALLQKASIPTEPEDNPRPSSVVSFLKSNGEIHWRLESCRYG